MKKEKKNKNGFVLEEEYKNSLIDARRQEMEFILPNHFTIFRGVVIPSKNIRTYGGKKKG